MQSRLTPGTSLANPFHCGSAIMRTLLLSAVSIALTTLITTLCSPSTKANDLTPAPVAAVYTMSGSISHDAAPAYEPQDFSEDVVTALAAQAPSEEESDVLCSYEVPDIDTSAKRYMDYRTITSRSSMQWQLQQSATTDENGFRRYNSDYMIALGTYYTGYECGKRFRITLDTGESFEAITGDVKSDQHTDALHQHRYGNVVEFIVDTECIPEMCRLMGDMSYAEAVNFSGNIAKIEELK